MIGSPIFGEDGVHHAQVDGIPDAADLPVQRDALFGQGLAHCLLERRAELALAHRDFREPAREGVL